ncbi:MAG: zinc ribbon domain-containing protein [Clostridia bacterium]|nr:zinc ribbon domain-containing protein [Clostridia bacterium]
MPLFEYKCDKCTKITEKLRAGEMKDAFAMCDCGGTLERIISNCNHTISGYCHKNEYSKTKMPVEAAAPIKENKLVKTPTAKE